MKITLKEAAERLELCTRQVYNLASNLGLGAGRPKVFTFSEIKVMKARNRKGGRSKSANGGKN